MEPVALSSFEGKVKCLEEPNSSYVQMFLAKRDWRVAGSSQGRRPVRRESSEAMFLDIFGII